MSCQGIGLSLEGSGEPQANGVWAGEGEDQVCVYTAHLAAAWKRG